MKIDHDIIRDLMPLYAEGMVSDKSRRLIEEHFAECEDCRRQLEAMKAPPPQVEYTEQAKGFKKYIRKRKLRFGAKVAGITALCVFAAVAVRLALAGLLTSVLMLDSFLSKVEVDDDPSSYSLYMGASADEKYRNKWDMDESIFPESIDGLDVQEYKMVYYNPWDAQYLSYLTVSYSDADYKAEVSRLSECGITKYKGYYSVTGFSGGEPLAMYADDYQGFVYAIDTPGEQNSITYVELIFCNYFYDLDYEEHIPSQYLPEGFNARSGNPYEKKMLKSRR
ncbi:MAG: zf-HC2 domain-containing protein [Ruminococcus sp.]|nr:zf-HC2 domain-containing protein [Ruminococcus sp.]